MLLNLSCTGHFILPKVSLVIILIMSNIVMSSSQSDADVGL